MSKIERESNAREVHEQFVRDSVIRDLNLTGLRKEIQEIWETQKQADAERDPNNEDSINNVQTQEMATRTSCGDNDTSGNKNTDDDLHDDQKGSLSDLILPEFDARDVFKSTD